MSDAPGILRFSDVVQTGFPAGKRVGFDPNGMVVRVYEKDKQGRVLHVGAK